MPAPNTKKVMTNVIASQPEDASFKEIMKELFFQHMIERGMQDVRQNRVITSKEMEHRIRTWQK